MHLRTVRADNSADLPLTFFLYGKNNLIFPVFPGLWYFFFMMNQKASFLSFIFERSCHMKKKTFCVFVRSFCFILRVFFCS